MGVYAGPADWWTDNTNSGRAHIATKGIIQDGLVLNLDAGVSSSYPGTGTTWSDLSGNSNDGTLNNGVGYSSDSGGILTFDGTDDHVDVVADITTSAATFCVWLKRNGSQNSDTSILLSRGSETTGINFRFSNNLGYHWNNQSNTWGWTSGLVPPDNEWTYYVNTISSTKATLYMHTDSGLSVAENTVSHPPTTIDALKIARDANFSNRYANINLSSAKIYNRALTADEVKQNFQALRGRYGI